MVIAGTAIGAAPADFHNSAAKLMKKIEICQFRSLNFLREWVKSDFDAREICHFLSIEV